MIVNQLQSLSENDAVKSFLRNRANNAEIANNSCEWIKGVNVEYVAANNLFSPKLSRIVIASNFENPTSHQSGIAFEDLFNVISI